MYTAKSIKTNLTNHFDCLMHCYSQSYVGLTELLNHPNTYTSDDSSINLQCASYQLRFFILKKTVYTDLIQIQFAIKHEQKFATLIQFKVHMYHDTCQTEVLYHPPHTEPSVIQRIIKKLAVQGFYDASKRLQHNEKYHINYALYHIVTYFRDYLKLRQALTLHRTE